MKKQTKNPTTKSPIMEIKSKITKGTESLVVASMRLLTPAEKKETLANNPEAQVDDARIVTYNSHLTMTTSEEAQALMKAIRETLAMVENEYTLLRADEIKKERKLAAKKEAKNAKKSK